MLKLHRPIQVNILDRFSAATRATQILEPRSLCLQTFAFVYSKTPRADSYLDAGVSGAKDSRPELNRLMADAHKRRFEVVVCWRFDRFARSVSHLLRALETFKALGIDFVSFSEQMDTSTPAGKMVFTVSPLERALSPGQAFRDRKRGNAWLRHKWS